MRFVCPFFLVMLRLLCANVVGIVEPGDYCQTGTQRVSVQQFGVSSEFRAPELLLPQGTYPRSL